MQENVEKNGSRFVFAHHEDSTAPAEHLLPEDLAERLRLLRAGSQTMNALYMRACICNEYALATPGYEGDDSLFAESCDKLATIIASDLPVRSPLRHKANILLAWQIPFHLRAQGYPIPASVARDLQLQLGDMQAQFLDGPPLTSTQYGYLAEFVAPAYLLNGPYFPHVATYREEANMVRDDNHDYYTLHPWGVNGDRVRKAPLSIKYRWELSPSEKVVTLAVGRLALAEALNNPEYQECPEFHAPNKEAHALRLAADIMISYTAGDSLSPEDEAFMQGLTDRLVAPTEQYIKSSATPDYESNAAVIQEEIDRRDQRWRERAARSGTE